MGFIKPFNNDMTLGGYISYLNYGEFKRTDELGNVDGEFGAGNLVIMTDYAMKFSKR